MSNDVHANDGAVPVDTSDAHSEAVVAETTEAAAEGGEKREKFIPRDRFDEQVEKRREMEEQLAFMAERVLANVPEHLKGLIPKELSPAKQAAWYFEARETGIFDTAPAPAPVPSVGRKPESTPTPPDFSSMSPRERLTAAYRGK
ncbi:hypothetical protein [Caenispirillum bisanense]|uniref:Uncharacterized protein n=1 Tax=Caenispirillum bisanense TaxID=414052 RepID=A0A286GM68_9PROT|nr:hypothetical protein [Caenispirillum bisanense]SOD96635.1 hypothetical protein SAMN05421508_10615 [Caenispirillum bisanense]